MIKRHRDALFIWLGACNPSAIAHSVVSACREVREEGGDVRTDPAIRLMVYQLAFLMGFEPISSVGIDDTSRWEEACRDRVPAEDRP